MKIEHFVIGAGVVVFLAVMGTFYLYLDKKGSSSYYQEEASQKKEGLEMAADGKTVLKNSSDKMNQNKQSPTAPAKKTLPPMSIDTSKTYSAVLKTSEGDITIVFEAGKTPQTVNNFIALAKSNFYDDTIFHRVVKDFMIQGGDPKGDGTGGPGYTVPAEFDPSLKHVRGAISTARLGDGANPKKESSGSQFFIVHKDVSQLDGEYTVFGRVTEGLDVVDRIATAEVSLSMSGEPSKPIKPVKILNIKIIEE
jgi:cyclophilin family peptidyl-prolyl cis-trans isomerase